MPRIGLAQMLARFARALDVLGPDGLREALRRHLEALPPSERDAFVASFEAPAPQPGGLLLLEIDAYVEDVPDAVRELTEERWRRRSRRWEEWEDEQSPVRHDVDDLYRRLGERFLAGDLLTAIDGYRRLLDVTVAAIDDPDGFHVSGSDDVQREALARLTWAVLGDTSVPVEERAANAVEVIDAYSAAVAVPTLHEVLSTRVEPLPDADLVLRSLQKACEAAARSLPSWQGHRLADLSIELVVSLDGVDALGQVGSRPDVSP